MIDFCYKLFFGKIGCFVLRKAKLQKITHYELRIMNFEL